MTVKIKRYDHIDGKLVPNNENGAYMDAEDVILVLKNIEQDMIKTFEDIAACKNMTPAAAVMASLS